MNIERHINQQSSRQRQIPNAIKTGSVEILHGQWHDSTIMRHDQSVVQKLCPKGPAPATPNPPRIRLEIPAVMKQRGDPVPGRIIRTLR
jgi:hypothetical protein